MKKVLCLSMCIFMLLHLGVMVSASYIYENEENNFSVELPDDFDEVEDMKFIGDDDSNFGVAVRAYTEDDKDYCIENMTEEELKERFKLLQDVSSLGMAAVQMNGSIELMSVSKIEHENGLNAVVLEFKTTAETEQGTRVRYQKVYEFTCTDNIYTFTFTSRDGGAPGDLDDSFDSIKIYEGEKLGLRSTFVKKGIPAIIVFGILILGIVRFSRKLGKR